jgi:hypothetical protein
MTMPSLNAAGSIRPGVFGAGAGVDVAGAVGHETGREHDVGDQVHHQPRIEFDVGVDRADFQQAVFEQLADAQALGAGEGEVELAGDAAFEQIQVLGATDAGHDHVQIMQLAGSALASEREKIRLLLVVALQHHTVAGRINASSAATILSLGNTTPSARPRTSRDAAASRRRRVQRESGEIVVVMPLHGFAVVELP